eukprot:TRINITY_DN1799_c2_g1_i1.p1 TRINITY_DN1799_c2_g1~~TRINITY_DN1799_c2_g1_i1.p1  ORF type:complete len:301 (-),score=45.15 TRINITY_DN1799_c2_g1_i1:385-1287(-)
MSRLVLDLVQGGLDYSSTRMKKRWKDEDDAWFKTDSNWRDEDVEWKKYVRDAKDEVAEMTELKQRWHEEDMEQRNVENARTLWLRFVERNRRDVEEKTEVVKAVLNITTVFVGFAVVTLTQLQIHYPGTPLFACMALVLGTCAFLLGCLLRLGQTYVSEAAEEEFMHDCYIFCHEYQGHLHPPQPQKTFENFWKQKCEPNWQTAFVAFQWGIIFFLLSLIPVGQVVFYDNPATILTWFITMGAITAIIFLVQVEWSSWLWAPPAPEKASWASMSEGLPFDWHKVPRRTQEDVFSSVSEGE